MVKEKSVSPQQDIGLQKYIWTNHYISGTISVWLMIPCLTKTKHNASPLTPHTNCQAWWWRGDDLSSFCSHRTWDTWDNNELHHVPEWLWHTCEAICPAVLAGLKLDHAVEHESRAHQHLNAPEWLEKKNAGMVKSRYGHHWDAVAES